MGSDIDIRNAFITDHLWIVHEVVEHVQNRYRRLPFEYDELLSIGTMGLMDAHQKFNEKFKIDFPTYAFYRVRGAMLDEIRNQSLSGRYVQDLKKKITEGEIQLQKKLGRHPSVKEICKYLSLTEKKYYELRFSFRIVDIELIKNLTSPDITPEDYCVQKDLTGRLYDFMTAVLSGREMYILINHYWRFKTFREIAIELACTASRINQIETRAIKKLAQNFSVYF